MKFKETYRGEDVNLSLGRFYNTDIRKLCAYQLNQPRLFPDMIAHDPRRYFMERVQSQDTIYFALRFRRTVVGYGAFDPIIDAQGTAHAWRKKWLKMKRHHVVGLLRLLLQFGFKELNLERITMTTTDFSKAANRLIPDVGFTLEGKLRKFHNYGGERVDVLLFGMLKEEF